MASFTPLRSAAVASGLGAGVMQVLVMYGDVLGGSLRPGSLYTPACASLSVFAVDALIACAFIVLNVLLSIIGWTAAYPRGAQRPAGAVCPPCPAHPAPTNSDSEPNSTVVTSRAFASRTENLPQTAPTRRSP